MRTRLVAAAVAGTLGLAGLGGALALPLAATAATEDGETTEEDADDAADRDGDTGERHERLGERVLDALSGLVDDGTITQEQAEAVASTLVEEVPARGHGPGGRDGGGPAGAGPRGAVDTAADVLDLPADEVRDALREGSTLAELAEESGVDPQSVVDALVDDAAERLDEAVASGRIDDDEAAERLADVSEWVETIVTEGLPDRAAHHS